MPEGIGYGRKAKARASREKAKKILSDGTIRGKPLSKKQRGFFGAIAGGQKMRKAEDGALVMPQKETAHSLIVEGFQEGGRIQGPTFEGAGGQADPFAGMRAIAEMYKVLESQGPGMGKMGINALRLGLASANRFVGPLDEVGFDALLRREVTRAFNALRSQTAMPMYTQTPPPPTPKPGVTPTP